MVGCWLVFVLVQVMLPPEKSDVASQRSLDRLLWGGDWQNCLIFPPIEFDWQVFDGQVFEGLGGAEAPWPEVSLAEPERVGDRAGISRGYRIQQDLEEALERCVNAAVAQVCDPDSRGLVGSD